MKQKELTGSVNMSGSLKAKLRDKNGKEILEMKKEGDIEKRFSRRKGKAIQIIWKESEIVHLQCKDCQNEWKLKDSQDWKGSFKVNGQHIKCLKCGREYKSG